jgi:hypothetical protein
MVGNRPVSRPLLQREIRSGNFVDGISATAGESGALENSVELRLPGRYLGGHLPENGATEIGRRGDAEPVMPRLKIKPYTISVPQFCGGSTVEMKRQQSTSSRLLHNYHFNFVGRMSTQVSRINHLRRRNRRRSNLDRSTALDRADRTQAEKNKQGRGE